MFACGKAVTAEHSAAAIWRNQESSAAPTVVGQFRAKIGRSGDYRTSLAVISATCRPWNRAIFNSFSLGWRELSAPAMVVAP